MPNIPFAPSSDDDLFREPTNLLDIIESLPLDDLDDSEPLTLSVPDVPFAPSEDDSAFREPEKFGDI